MRSLLCLALLVSVCAFVSTSPATAQKFDETSADQKFGRLLTAFLEDPLGEKGRDQARALVGFTIQTPKSSIVLSEPEMKWLGKLSDDRSLLLFAAYAAGNTRSQMLTGVVQNDRYSGLVTLFSVYQKLQDKDKEFKIADIDELRKLHADGKLLAHIVELDKQKPSKLSVDDEKALSEMIQRK